LLAIATERDTAYFALMRADRANLSTCPRVPDFYSSFCAAGDEVPAVGSEGDGKLFRPGWKLERLLFRFRIPDFDIKQLAVATG